MSQIVSIFDDITLKELEESTARELEGLFNAFYIVTYEVDISCNF